MRQKAGSKVYTIEIRYPLYGIYPLLWSSYCKVNDFSILTLTLHIGVAVHDDRGCENQLCTKDLQEVFSNLMEVVNNWFNLGLALGIQVDTLEGIDSNKNSNQDCLREMLTHWLRSSPSRTWSDICIGLRSDTVKQNNLADKIEEKYKGTYSYLFLSILLQFSFAIFIFLCHGE